MSQDDFVYSLRQALEGAPEKKRSGVILQTRGARLSASDLMEATLGDLIALPQGRAKVRALLRDRVELDLLRGSAKAGDSARLLGPAMLPRPEQLRGKVIDPLGAHLDGQSPSSDHVGIASFEEQIVPARPAQPKPLQQMLSGKILHSGLMLLDILDPIRRGTSRLFIGPGADAFLQDILQLPRAMDVIWVALGPSSTQLLEIAHDRGAIVVCAPPSAPPAQVVMASKTAIALAQALPGDRLVLIDDLAPLIAAHRSLGAGAPELWTELGALLNHAGGAQGDPSTTILAATSRIDRILASGLAVDRLHRIEKGQVTHPIRNSKLPHYSCPRCFRGAAGVLQRVIWSARGLQDFEKMPDLDEVSRLELARGRKVEALLGHRLGVPRSVGEACILATLATFPWYDSKWYQRKDDTRFLLDEVSVEDCEAREGGIAERLLDLVRTRHPEVMEQLELGGRIDEPLQRVLVEMIEEALR